MTHRSGAALVGIIVGTLLSIAGAAPAEASFATACAGTSSTQDAFPDAGLAADCLRAYGIAFGKSDGSFGERDLLLRSQLSSLLVRQLTAAGVDLVARTNFPDVVPDSLPDVQVRDEIEMLAGANVIAGFPDGSFRPTASLSVAQAATEVVRVMQLIHAHNPSAPDIRDQGSTDANYAYARQHGLLDAGATSSDGRAYDTAAASGAGRGLQADLQAQTLERLVARGVIPSYTTVPAIGQRSSRDRPDDTPKYQVHVIYAVPADGTDRSLDTDGSIAGSVHLFSDWLSGQTNGTTIRVDTYHRQPDIGFLRLSQTDAQLSADSGANLLVELIVAVQAAGWNKPGALYAVYYDGGQGADACGRGFSPASRASNVSAVFMGAQPNPSRPPCNVNPLTPGRETPGFLDLAVLHEIFHNLGAVPMCAPHYDNGHTNDNANDLMAPRIHSDGQPTFLDPGRDDYFGHSNPNCLDVADSAFLEPVPPNAQLPPGWAR